MKPVLLDTGVIVALLDRNERYHAACSEAMRGLERPLVTCEAVIAESCYLLRGLSGAAETILENVARGVFQVPFQISRSAAAVRSTLRKYREVAADFADACLIQFAEELDTGDIFTLDSDFRFYRWRRNRAFNLLVPLD
jgi:predicted nucleic acid-binding protein